MTCLRCPKLTSAKHHKYCSRKCMYDARRRIDPNAVMAYMARGLNSVQISELIHASPSAIRNSVYRLKRACKPLTVSNAGIAQVRIPGSILIGSTA